MLFTVFVATLITEGITQTTHKRPLPRLPDTYKDIFAGHGGKPRLGTTTGTCWIRGGTCTHIRKCPSFNFDSGISGCNSRFRVCCKNFQQLPPTVGIERARDISENSEDLSQDVKGSEVILVLKKV